MRIRHIIAALSCLMLIGCETAHSTSTPRPSSGGSPIILPPLYPTTRTPTKCVPLPKKKNRKVTLYNSETPKTSYRVLGQAHVSRYDRVGVQRDDASLNHLLQARAEALGGDGLVDVTTVENGLTGKVIAYERALF